MDDFETRSPTVGEAARYFRDIAEIQYWNGRSLGLLVAGIHVALVWDEDSCFLLWHTGKSRLVHSANSGHFSLWLFKAYICYELDIEPLATQYRLTRYNLRPDELRNMNNTKMFAGRYQ